MNAETAIQIAAAFTWLGMVLAISFLEAPLKFRAPGVTIPLGVGIGRLVFRALNLVEAAFAIVLAVTLVVAWPGSWPRPVLAGAAIVVLVVQAAGLRPLMDARVRDGRMADRRPRHRLHVGYVVLESVKVVLLVGFGVVALVG